MELRCPDTGIHGKIGAQNIVGGNFVLPTDSGV